MIELIGYAGIVIINAAQFPQLYKMVKVRKTDQHSAVYYFMIALAIEFYLAYAVLTNDPVFIVSNALGQIQPWALMYLTIKWKNGDGKEVEKA